MIARFQRDDTRIRMVRDTLGDGYYIFSDTPTDQRVEHFPLHLYPFHCDLYRINGYQRLILCLECGGKGWRWVADRNGEADRDECPTCQGNGGR